ncbi:type IV pilus modification protein PilV [Halomonas nitroreducens]|uniref:Type IV pilus modification protein PilV n=1 Tax=Halomonas nitroreducens TaxID=447425 RepID=A0A431V2H3_9GAMM|nr:type IV pilus modification protein PilV [Halomonas nitroreducens]RTR02874.1 type IV pilus modification protein PilV [Halomonas nitroreducens]
MPSCRGFTLIEVLVAVLVLSISLLGLAALQLKSLQGSHVAYQRAVANLAAQDAGERLWEWLGQQEGLACPDDNELSTLQRDWTQAWENDLPGFSSSRLSWADRSACRVDVTVRWKDERFAYRKADGDMETESVSLLTYTLAIPHA